MKVKERKRNKSTPIDLSNYIVKKSEYSDKYDCNDDDYLCGLSEEEAEKMGIISVPKVTKIIDGETAFFSAIKNGEDW